MAEVHQKIRELDELARTLDEVRARKAIVLCHGVFDLLHVGHIRHLQHARKLGDILVVTLTPDRYVNKGPHRPAFHETLRAEALAALDVVDYVAINRWPTSVESIRLLRPHYYVKGSEYRDLESDVTGNIRLEEEAVQEVGGQIIFTDDITFSSSALINRHLAVFSQEVRDYLQGFCSRYSPGEVLKYISGAKGLRVLVVGESIVDEYVYGQVLGKSGKDPMLALLQEETERFAGGILAVGNHVADFVGSVGLLTSLGADSPHEGFIRTKLNPRIETHFLHRRDAPTIVKRRFIEKYSFTKLLEVYEMNDGPMLPSDSREICAALEELVPAYDVVLAIDYGHGLFTKEAIDVLIRRARFLAVNAQSNAGNFGYNPISRYASAHYACMAENEARLEARDRHTSLHDIMLDIARRLDFGRLVVTRGRYGSICYTSRDGFVEVPGVGRDVVDRMGAGDTYLAVSALCVAQGAPPEVACFLGNAAGAEAVAMVGHRRSLDPVSFSKHVTGLLK